MSFTQDDVTSELNGIYRLSILKVYETRKHLLSTEPTLVLHSKKDNSQLTNYTACFHNVNGYLRIL